MRWRRPKTKPKTKLGASTINVSDKSDALTPPTIALAALGWILQDERRADRLLSLTGLTADQLRTGLEEPAVLSGILGFLANHEPDLIAAADVLGMQPEEIIAAHRELNA